MFEDYANSAADAAAGDDYGNGDNCDEDFAGVTEPHGFVDAVH